MAFPVLPLLFAAGSAVANTIGARQQEKALASMQAAERARQKQFDDQSFALNTASQNRFADVPGQMETKATDLAEMFAAPSQEAPAEPIITTPASSSNIVMSREGAAMDKAKGETDARAANLGNLRAFGDVLGTASRMQGRDAGQLGLIGSMRRGSQSVLPLELEAAMTKGRGLRTLGDILSAGSMLTGSGMAGGMADSIGAFFNPAAMRSSPTPRPNPRLL
jgi:hypothetical protein